MALSNNYTITVDIKRNIAVASQTPLFVSNDSAILYIKVLDGGKPFDYSSVDRITVSFRRPDKVNVQGLGEYDSETGMIKYQLGTQEMEIQGVVETVVQLYVGTDRISTRPFSIKIFSDYEEAIESSKDLTILQSLFIEVDQVKTDTLAAKDEALDASLYARNIRDNFGHKGEYDNAKVYKDGNVVSYGGINYMCILETTAGINPLNGTYFTVVSPQATINEQTWTATEGQRTFTLTNGKYVVGKGNIEVWVGGVPQIKDQGYGESSETTITLTEGVPAGTIVYAKWFEGHMYIAKGHQSSHTLGGQDEIDVTQLRNFKENVTDKFATVDAQLADIPNQTYITEKAKQTEVDNLKQQLVPKRYIFGGQLEKLKYSLSNPLEQFTGIAFVGDSITWGLGATGNPADYNTGRDGTLSDIRDNFASESFVNDFKRYVGSKYMGNVAPVLSNWQYSTSGQAIATYTKQQILYPYGGDFAYTTTGTINSTLSRALTGTLTGWQLVINIDSTATGEAVISFPFTGEEFTLSIDSVTNSMDYELIVDGVSQGVFTTVPGVDGMVAGFDNRRKHTFPYVRNKTVQIKTVKNSYVGLQTLRFGGIIIDKKIRITNQGIIGTKAYYYKQRNMTGNTSGDGVAVGSRDNYIFCQLGSNDRMIETAYAKGSNEFKKNLKLLVDELKTFGDVIMMVANPAANESTSSFSFTMQDARNVVYRLAKENTLDFIDNYSIFGNVSTAIYTTDGLHPNDVGYEVISRNIINSLEFN